MPQRILVTGYGIISSIGNTVQECYQSMIAGVPGIGRICNIDTVLRDELIVGEVKRTLPELLDMAGIEPEEGYSRNTVLGIIASSEAFHHARLHENRQLRTGLLRLNLARHWR